MALARIAQLAEAEAVTALVNLAFRVEEFFIDGDRIEVPEVRSCFDKGFFLVIDGEQSLAACVYLEPRGTHCYLGLLSVDPALQGRGLGAKLVAAAEEFARTKNFEAMDLHIVNLREELPPFYRKLGYTQTGTSPFTPGQETKLPCSFIEMSKAL